MSPLDSRRLWKDFALMLLGGALLALCLLVMGLCCAAPYTMAP